MPPRGRKPRANPLIPVAESTNVPPIEQAGPAPICGACWPDGWPEGGDFASCEHGEWATDPHLVRQAVAELTDDGTGPYVIDGVTTDGTPVKVTIRPGEVALVSLSEVQLGSVALSPAPDPAWSPLTPTAPVTADELDTARAETMPAAASPFAPKLAEVDPAELDTGSDVMFMPDGG